MMRTGADYLSALNDGRVVLVDGQQVDDVTTHPAFAPVAATIAEMFDLAADPALNMQYTAPETGATANRTFGIPRSREELRLRREAIETWARHTHGWVGRSPDHVGTFLASFAAHPEVFAGEGRDLSANVTAFHRRLLDENLYVSYAIIPPQVSRATTASGWEGEFLQAGVVRETDEGIVVRGSQMLATGAAIADEVFVSCVKPLNCARPASGSGYWSRRTRCCVAPRRICRRRTCREKALPARKGARRRRDSRRGVVPGPQALPPALLPVVGQSGHRCRADRGVSGECPLRCPSRRSRVRIPIPRRRSRAGQGTDERADRVADLP